MSRDIPDVSDNDNAQGMKIRCLAYEILTDRSGKYRKELLASQLGVHDLARRDKKWLTQVVYGVERRRRTLRRIAQKYSRKFSAPSGLIDILSIGIYQLLFLDKVPAHAAINTSVRLAKQYGYSKQSGYVNALLRNIHREAELVEPQPPGASILPLNQRHCWRFSRAIFPDAQKNFSEYCAVVYSYPTALVQNWFARFDRSLALQLLQAGNYVPPLILRPRIPLLQLEAQLREQGIKFTRCENLLRLDDHQSIDNLPGYREGHWVVSGPTAVAVVQAMELAPGMKVLDLCAAPGTKALHIVDAMANSGLVVAADISLARLALLPPSIEHLGVDTIHPLVIDATNLPRSFYNCFDRVLVDAPCSNSAVLAKRAEARWRIAPEILRQLQQQQLALIDQAFKALRPGGVLLYSTCSLELEENEQVIDQFLRRNPGCVCKDQIRILPLPPDLDGGTFFKLGAGKK